MLKSEKIILPISRQYHLSETRQPQEVRRDIARKLLCLLRKCVSVNQLREIQAQKLLNSVEKPNFLIPKAIDLRSFAYASLLFSAMEEPNEYSFNVMIRGLTTKWENHGAALSLYRRMKFSGLKPDNFTYPFVFIACGNLSELEIGRSVHSSLFKVGLERDDHIHHSLITMYAKCGELGYARKVFDEITEKDLVSWNSMISGYSQRGYAKDAVGLFKKLKEEGFEPDEKTLVSVLGACGDLADLRMGKLVEKIAVEKKMEMNTFLGSALISMYGKCGELGLARTVFEKMRKKDRITWNAMITVYAQNGMSEESIGLFHEMKAAGTYPDAITLVMVLSACASIGALDLGKWVETYASDRGYEHNIYVATGLVDMYAKCGSLDNALRVFEAMPTKNEVSWNAMICALAFHGRVQEALSLFNRMTVPPNDVTFIGVLSACVHAGLVDEGRQFFHQMSCSFGLVPKIEHYSCMVDLLSRAGLLNEAWDFIEKMPENPDEIMLGALLGACQKRKNVEIGEKAMKLLLDIEPSNSSNYVISSKVYADLRMWDECAKMRVLMRDRGVAKTPGCSWIEIDGELREFHAGDYLQGDRENINLLFNLLIEEIKREGNVREEV